MIIFPDFTPQSPCDYSAYVEKHMKIQKELLIKQIEEAKKYVLDNNIDLKNFKAATFKEFCLYYLCDDNFIQSFLSMNNSHNAFNAFVQIDWDIYTDLEIIRKVEMSNTIKDIIE